MGLEHGPRDPPERPGVIDTPQLRPFLGLYAVLSLSIFLRFIWDFARLATVAQRDRSDFGDAAVPEPLAGSGTGSPLNARMGRQEMQRFPRGIDGRLEADPSTR